MPQVGAPGKKAGRFTAACGFATTGAAPVPSPPYQNSAKSLIAMTSTKAVMTMPTT